MLDSKSTYCVLALLVLSWISRVSAQTYTCTTSGKFRYADSTCRSFYMCVLYNGNYVQSNYTCPQNTIFDGTSQTCSTTATCIDAVCDDLPASPLIVYLSDPNAVNCTTYIECIGSTTKVAIIETCPSGYYYNSGLESCWYTGSC